MTYTCLLRYFRKQFTGKTERTLKKDTRNLSVQLILTNKIKLLSGYSGTNSDKTYPLKYLQLAHSSNIKPTTSNFGRSLKFKFLR